MSETITEKECDQCIELATELEREAVRQQLRDVKAFVNKMSQPFRDAGLCVLDEIDERLNAIWSEEKKPDRGGAGGDREKWTHQNNT